MPKMRKIAGAWHTVTDRYRKVDGQWHQVVKSYRKVDGIWQLVFGNREHFLQPYIENSDKLMNTNAKYFSVGWDDSLGCYRAEIGGKATYGYVVIGGFEISDFPANSTIEVEWAGNIKLKDMTNTIRVRHGQSNVETISESFTRKKSVFTGITNVFRLFINFNLTTAEDLVSLDIYSLTINGEKIF